MVRKVIDMKNKLYLLEPSSAPTWTLVSQLNTKDCVNPKIEWLFQKQGTQTTLTEWNTCQIFRKNIEMTKTLYCVTDRQYLRKKKGIELLKDFECALTFGRRQKRSLTIQGYPCPVHTMGGIFEFAKKYGKKSVRKISTMQEMPFEKLLRHVFRYGSITRYLACGKFPGYMQQLQTRMRKVPTTQTYGIDIFQYISPHGTVNVVLDPILGDCGFLVDLSHLAFRPLMHRACKLQTNVQNPGDVIYKDSYISEWTLEIRQPDNLVRIGIPGTPPSGIPEGSTYGTTTPDRNDWSVEDWEPTLDEILGLEEVF